MQKNISLILANTERSKYYFNEIIKNKIFIKKIIFYSKKRVRYFIKLRNIKILKKYIM